MNSFIEFYYNIKILEINEENDYFYFYYDNFLYRLYSYDFIDDIKLLYSINKKMVNNSLMSQIILNKNHDIVSFKDNVGYVLIKIFINVKKYITLEEISFLNNFIVDSNDFINWGYLWSRKIDYFEDLISENSKKFPLLIDSFYYFVGLAENAISYYNNISFNNNSFVNCISHKKIYSNDTIECLYNPLNILIDSRVRDVAEYIKNKCFFSNKFIDNELIMYFKNNNITFIEAELLVARLLFPTFYFDLYDDIISNNSSDKDYYIIVKNISLYEYYIGHIINLIKSIYSIPEIDWLIKKDVNLH